MIRVNHEVTSLRQCWNSSLSVNLAKEILSDGFVTCQTITYETFLKVSTLPNSDMCIFGCMNIFISLLAARQWVAVGSILANAETKHEITVDIFCEAEHLGFERIR